jgi:hypothetical protein
MDPVKVEIFCHGWFIQSLSTNVGQIKVLCHRFTKCMPKKMLLGPVVFILSRLMEWVAPRQAAVDRLALGSICYG